jgi:hypothetical protein
MLICDRIKYKKWGMSEEELNNYHELEESKEKN